MKKKISAIALIACLLVLGLGGATYAYFTDTKKVENTFTSGNVAIELSEAEVKNDGLGNLIEDVDADRILGNATKDYGVLFPSQTIFKDPTIKNTGSLDAYMGAIITVEDKNGNVADLIGIDGTNLIDINAIISGGVLGEIPNMSATNYNGLDAVANDDYVVIQKVENDSYKFFVFALKPQAKDAEIELFNTLTINADWDNAEMENFKDFSITVDAYATQTLGFADAYTALTSAFSTQFSF